MEMFKLTLKFLLRQWMEIKLLEVQSLQANMDIKTLQAKGLNLIIYSENIACMQLIIKMVDLLNPRCLPSLTVVQFSLWFQLEM